MERTARLTQAIEAVCPIHGVSVGKWEDRRTWRIHFSPEATPAQREAGTNVLRDFDASPQADILADQAQARLEAKAMLRSRAFVALTRMLAIRFGVTHDMLMINLDGFVDDQ